MSENSERNEEPIRREMSRGSKSLIIFGLIFATFTPLMIWSSQPQFHGSAGFGMAMMLAFCAFFIWLPMIIVATVQSIKAVRRNEGRAQGVITLILILGTIFLLIKSGAFG